MSTGDGKTKKDTAGRHGEKAEKGWKYRKAYFRDFDGKYYLCTISVMQAKNGAAVYNIGKIQERSFPDVGGSSAKSGAQNEEKASFTGKVTQGTEKVKRKLSAEDEIEEPALNQAELDAAASLTQEAVSLQGKADCTILDAVKLSLKDMSETCPEFEAKELKK